MTTHTLAITRHRAAAHYSGIHPTHYGWEVRHTNRRGELVCLCIHRGVAQQAYRVIVGYLRAGVIEPDEAAMLNRAVNQVVAMQRPRPMSFVEWVVAKILGRKPEDACQP